MGLLDPPARTAASLAVDPAFRNAYVAQGFRRRDVIRPRLTVRQVMASVTAPTVTVATSSGLTSPVSVDLIAGGMVTVGGAPKLVHPGSTYPYTATYNSTGTRAPDTNNNTNNPYAVEFFTDAPRLEMTYINRGGTAVRVWVDDQAVGSLTPTTRATTGSAEYVLIDWTSVGGSKVRKVRFELAGGDLGNINLPTTSGTVSYWRVWPTPPKPILACIGDSLTGGSGMSTSGTLQIHSVIGELLGLDGHNLGIGGTGYVTSVGGYANTAPAQAQAVATSYASTPPAVILLAHGHNDGTAQNTAVATAATTTAQTLRTAFPRALIVATGPLGRWSLSGASTAQQATESAIQAALAPYIDLWIPQVVGVRPWIVGGGTTAALSNDGGNADAYIGSDAVHWNDAGLTYVGERLAREIAAALTA